MSEKGCQRTYNLNNLKIGGLIDSENIRVNGRIIAEGGIEYLGGSNEYGISLVNVPSDLRTHLGDREKFLAGNFNISANNVQIVHKRHADALSGSPQLRSLVVNTINVINVMNYFTGTRPGMNVPRSTSFELKLPPATKGDILFLIQIDPVKPRENTRDDYTMTISCSGNDIFKDGSVIESRDSQSGDLKYNQANNNTSLIYRLEIETQSTSPFDNPSESYFTTGSKLFFSCAESGVWKVGYLFTGKGEKTYDGNTNYGGTFDWG